MPRSCRATPGGTNRLATGQVARLSAASREGLRLFYAHSRLGLPAAYEESEKIASIGGGHPASGGNAGFVPEMRHVVATRTFHRSASAAFTTLDRPVRLVRGIVCAYLSHAVEHRQGLQFPEQAMGLGENRGQAPSAFQSP